MTEENMRVLEDAFAEIGYCLNSVQGALRHRKQPQDYHFHTALKACRDGRAVLSTKQEGEERQHTRGQALEEAACVVDEFAARAYGNKTVEFEKMIKAAQAIRALIPLPAPDAGWRTIDSAPKDGGKVLVCDAADYRRVWVACWCYDNWEAGGKIILHVTHWLPLPAPPVGGEGK